MFQCGAKSIISGKQLYPKQLNFVSYNYPCTAVYIIKITNRHAEKSFSNFKSILSNAFLALRKTTPAKSIFKEIASPSQAM